MNENEDKVSAAIAEQAGDRFVLNDAGPLDARESEALAAWIKASPAHVKEFLGVATIARDLRELKTDPEYSLDAVIERARAEDNTVEPLEPHASAPLRGPRPRYWQVAAMTLAASAVLSLSVLLIKYTEHHADGPVARGLVTQHFSTGHGEQLTRRLADNSLLHLNTDSAVSIQYGSTERRVTLTAGEASFEVAHERNRVFRVFAGPAQVTAVGTMFDVRLEPDATVVVVVEGRVTVSPSLTSKTPVTPLNENQPTRLVELGPDRQLKLISGEWPPTLVAMDSQNATAWLHRQISFDHETLERVAAEYNRYALKPIVIDTPALRTLLISGTFSTDSSEEIVAFLRSLKGVRVEVTGTQIRVLGR